MIAPSYAIALTSLGGPGLRPETAGRTFVEKRATLCMASSVLPSSATINSKPYTQRIQTDILSYLEDQVRGLDVLDVGCCDHDVDNPPSGDRWMHARLGRAAKSILGMDILERDCAKLRARGYDVVAGDACTVSLDRTFDVVVAGEIIEHVENPGQLVRNL